jgi:tetratricopeptide (TPR) repeat protein
MNDKAQDQFQRLLGYLDSDPDNPALLAEAVRAGLAMHRGDFAAAAACFEGILDQKDDPATRFNVAWSRAMIGDKGEALAVLDPATIEGIPSAAMLRVQLLHEAGDFEAALTEGTAALSRFPDDRGLLAAMATLALDVDDADLARDCVLRAGDHPEALAAAGVLDLQAGDIASARAAFDRSLATREHNPRAWIGRGLAGLNEQNPVDAARDLDRGAQQFGDHIGSWIAAGWAWYLAGDLGAAQQRFERALAIDPAFAESHGSLAVIDIARGDRDAARHKTATALRLDRECFSAALAQALLASDDPVKSAAIVERAMTTPIDGGQFTLASYLAGLTRPTIH